MRKVGTGITERSKPETVRASPAMLIEFFRGINKTMSEPWGGQEFIIQSARSRLQQIKSAAPNIHDDMEGYNRVFVERVTEGWYLQAIDAEAQTIEGAVTQGAIWHAVACAMRIGELVTELRMKQLWEPDALHGRKRRDDLRNARDKNNRDRRNARESEWRRWNDAAADIWKRRPTLGKSAVARHLKISLKIADSERTIRAHIKKAGTAG